MKKTELCLPRIASQCQEARKRELWTHIMHLIVYDEEDT
jgi:hypothetical protein